MYMWEIVEGKDRPNDLGMPQFETGPGKYTMALMWSMTKPLWGIVKTVIKDRVFCVLKGWLVCMREESMLVQW